VYGRMTGWGQNGPLAARAGHDIDYIAITGALAAVGTKDSGPVPPLNLIGDFGGGGMLMAFGIASALLQSKLSGKGTVIDAAMAEGTAMLMAMPYSLKAQGLWPSGRASNLLDGGAPFYGTYQTSDGEWMAVGAIEEPFWQELIAKLELDEPVLKNRMDRSHWPKIGQMIEQKIGSKTRAHWTSVFEGSDACVAPILTMDEVADHPHNEARKVFAACNGVLQPAPAPRFDGKIPDIPETNMTAQDYEVVLAEWSDR
ncbi:MAG: CoA transferase, partial [Rhizobiaceae bacterium]